MGQLVQFGPILVLVVAGYFLLFRPQQQRAKQHQQMVAGVKRGDTVVLSSGLIGKVVRVEDKELGVEVAQNVTVKVVKSMVSDVRPAGGAIAANDAKS
ncbi:MAG TPA: preprotein translocase subunit YajC [Caulobacteraceae bacterium]|nr:preprotein translocase subunit YajC [Caulobacteraceae bacterium]